MAWDYTFHRHLKRKEDNMKNFIWTWETEPTKLTQETKYK